MEELRAVAKMEYYVQRHCCIERARLERKWLVQVGLLNREQGIDAKRGGTRAPDSKGRWAEFHSGTWTPNGGKNEGQWAAGAAAKIDEPTRR